jgi:hypothetical protein
MPRFQVSEKRSYIATWIIDAEDEQAARIYRGDLIAEWDDANVNSMGEEIVSCEQFNDDYEG